MAGLLEVTADDISRLDQNQLTDLLRRLLLLEAGSSGIPARSLHVSMNILAADGGEDGRIQWQDGPPNTDWLPNRLTLFQCKAQDMDAPECGKEVLRKQGNGKAPALKNRVKEVLDSRGSYVLFCNRQYNAANKVPRIQAIVAAVAEAESDECSESADIRIYDADDIMNWVNKYFATVVAVLEYVGAAPIRGLQTWGMWSKYKENRFCYVSDDKLSADLATIRNYFTEPRSIARIVGLSGRGKTRLALEAFRRPEHMEEDVSQQLLSDAVVYVGIGEPPPDLVGQAIEWRNQGLEGLLVVDNCSLDLHHQLAREVEHSDSKLSLLTLDYDPDNSGVECPAVIVEPASDTVITGIVKQGYPGLPDEDVEHVVRFADGFPRMAVLIAAAQLRGEERGFTLQDGALLRKLLWGRDPRDEEAESVIAACALFDSLGFEGARGEQRCYVAEQICGIDQDRFYRHAHRFIERGILIQRGDYVRVAPLPLALRLAEQWWTTCAPERRQSILTQQMPDGLGEAMADRFAMLDYLAEAKEIVEALCGDEGPFSKADVLDSKWGSRLFRSLVEVNPGSTVRALESAFGDWTTKQLLEVQNGRRDIVRALEKLCFWPETFPTAARLLLACAAAENETWANNATGQFLQLFHVILPGTQAALSQRLTIVDAALADESLPMRLLGVRALGNALEYNHFTRRGGVERQGSRAPARDWEPTYGEVRCYWKGALDRLVPIACEDDGLGELARTQITDHVRSLVSMGRLDDLEEALVAVISKRGRLWPKALESCYQTLRFDGEKHGEAVRKRIDSWISMLQPESVRDRLRLFVSNAPADMVKGEDGHYVDLAVGRAKDLARDIAQQPEGWKDWLPTVFKGDQRQGYAFGGGLGEALASNPREFIDTAVSILCDVSDGGNPSVLSGLVATVHREHESLVSELLDTLADTPKLVGYLVPVTCSIEPKKKDLARLQRVVDARQLHVSHLRAFCYGRVLDHLPADTIMEFCQAMLAHGSEGAWAALDVVSMYCHANEAKWDACRGLFREILTSPSLTSDGMTGTLDDHHWEEAAGKLLEVEGGDAELARSVFRSALQFSEPYGRALDLDDSLRKALRTAVSTHAEVVWPLIGTELLTSLRRLQVVGLIRGNTADSGLSSIIKNLSVDYLMNWCDQNGDRAPYVLARVVPVFTKNTQGRLEWHPLALAIIQRYGDNEEVLSGLWLSMYPYSGSADELVSRWQLQIEALAKLADQRLPTVRGWARDCTMQLHREIADTRARQTERERGR